MDNWAIELADHWKKKEDVANVFGLVLYTDVHPNIKKVLRDNDYWASLDEISGPNWPIFSIRPKQGSRGFPNFSRDSIGMMVMVWREPRENVGILQAFGLESTENLPIFVIFCKDSGGEILSRQIPLKDASVDEAYASLKAAITVGAEAVNGLLQENRKNDVGAFGAVDQAVQRHMTWKRLKDALGLFRLIKELTL
jgi:hypothetical protein